MEEIFVSDYIGINYEVFESKGIFDSIVNKDSEFYINIIRLKNAKTDEFANSYDSINDYFRGIVKCLKHAKYKDLSDRFYREAVRKFELFHEVNGINLGFSESTKGAGFGKKLSRQIIFDLYDIVKAGIEDPEIFHLIGIFEKDVGPDRLSDMIASIIINDIENYTKRVQKELDINRTTRSRLSFDSEGFIINTIKNSRVYFLPKEILHNLPIARSWEEIDKVVMENNSIRSQLNDLLGDDLAKWLKKSISDKKDFLKNQLFKNVEKCNAILDAYRDVELGEIDYCLNESYSFSNTWRLLRNEIDLASPAGVHSKDSFVIAKYIINNFRNWVEEKGGWKPILDTPQKSREKTIQRLIHLSAIEIVKNNDLDFSCEPNNGHGPVDFKISRGNDKTVIEVKLSSNSKYLKGYTNQLRQYALAENTDKMIYVFVNVGNDERETILRDKITQDDQDRVKRPYVIIINAKKQLSASLL